VLLTCYVVFELLQTDVIGSQHSYCWNFQLIDVSNSNFNTTLLTVSRYSCQFPQFILETSNQLATDCVWTSLSCHKQCVALTGRNRTGPPCSVGYPTVHAPAAGPPACRQHYRRRQTPASKPILAN